MVAGLKAFYKNMASQDLEDDSPWLYRMDGLFFLDALTGAMFSQKLSGAHFTNQISKTSQGPAKQNNETFYHGSAATTTKITGLFAAVIICRGII